MPYKHGIEIKENETSIPVPLMTEGFVPVFIGTAPVNQVKNISKAVNEPILCYSFAEAQEALGYSEDYASYTLCAAMDACFKAFGVAPVVFINVLDPTNASHKASYTESITLSNKTGKGTSKGVLIDNTLVVKNGNTTLDIDEDYTVEMDSDGYPVFTVTAQGVTSITVTGNKLAPGGVTNSDVIGAYDSATGKYTGIQAVDLVWLKHKVCPSLLAAPGFSKASAVGLALSEKSRRISSMYKCECVVDIDASANGAKVYSNAASVKASAGFLNENMIAMWPCVKYAGKVMPYSAMFTALCVYWDIQHDQCPGVSPSNEALPIAAICDEDGNEIWLTQDQANELNGEGIVTALNNAGWKSWGNNTAKYPGTTDPKDRFIHIRRMFSWWGNHFIMKYSEKNDKNINPRLIEEFTDSENQFGNGLVTSGYMAGMRFEYRASDNPTSQLLDGKFIVREAIAPYAPAEYILDIVEYDPKLLEAAMGGEA